MTVFDVAIFLRQWLRNPRSVAAVAPSGKALASLITQGISTRTGSVVELGPETGVFTQTLIARGVREENLNLVERSAEFAELLKKRFPNAEVLEIDAEQLALLRCYIRLALSSVVLAL